jgi:hypothetical protein
MFEVWMMIITMFTYMCIARLSGAHGLSIDVMNDQVVPLPGHDLSWSCQSHKSGCKGKGNKEVSPTTTTTEITMQKIDHMKYLGSAKLAAAYETTTQYIIDHICLQILLYD